MQKLIILVLLTFIFHTNIFAKEDNYFLMLKNNKVNVRYGPGFDYPVKYIYKKINLPVEVIDKKENFRKIIDHKKNSGWIHRSLLRKSKSLITTSTKILFKRPTKFSKPLARLDKGRLLIIKKCKKDYLMIRKYLLRQTYVLEKGRLNDQSGWKRLKNLTFQEFLKDVGMFSECTMTETAEKQLEMAESQCQRLLCCNTREGNQRYIYKQLQYPPDETSEG